MEHQRVKLSHLHVQRTCLITKTKQKKIRRHGNLDFFGNEQPNSQLT